MSDTIVLWRMCVVWDYKRIALVFGTLLVVTMTALNIANIVLIADAILGLTLSSTFSNEFVDLELIYTYGLSTVGLSAAFMSLASNFGATLLVGWKTW